MLAKGVLGSHWLLLLLHVITPNCSEMHWILGIPIIAHSLLQPLRTDICQIGYVVCEYMTVWGAQKLLLSIEYVSIIEIDFLYRWAILERRTNMYINNQWQPTQQVTCIYLTVPSSLTSEIIWLRDLYRFMYRQHVYDLEIRRGDCLMKWLIMLGFMDVRGPRVCRRSMPVLS